MTAIIRKKTGAVPAGVFYDKPSLLTSIKFTHPVFEVKFHLFTRRF